MDLAAYREPREEHPPSGENLEYDPVFTDLEIAAQPGEEHQMGDTVVAAEEPDWSEVEAKALEVMGRSHEIRAGVFLSEAVLHTKGLPAFAAAVGYVRALIEDNWDTCHPELDEDDGDATMRINAVQGLASADRVIRALRRAGLTDSRTFGQMSLRHIEVAEGTVNMPPDLDEVPDMVSVGAAFKDSDREIVIGNAEAVDAALGDIAAIDAIFVEKTPGEGPLLDPLTDALKQIKRALAAHSGVAVAADAETEAAAPAAARTGGGAGGSPAPSGGGAINSPTDVINTLDRIMDYYARQEPSSPLPILLERAKRLVNADFMTIIEDMAKDGLDEVRRIGGIKGKDEYEY